MTDALVKSKFWIVKPAPGRNYLRNPRFDPPDGVEDWGASGAGVTLDLTADEQRYGAYSMRVNAKAGVTSAAYYPGLYVEEDYWYTFSCDVKGTAGQVMTLIISDVANDFKATTTFTANGHWQRKSVSWQATESASGYYVAVSRNAVSSNAPFYVDGVQFEQASKASTLMHGYAPGCRWEGAVRNSSSFRGGVKGMGMGGELVDLDDYGYVESTVGLGHGDWNQILTKMTSGGDLYQTHTRKSRNFSIVMGIKGADTGDLMRKRQAILDAIRPDALEGQEMIVRYQGFDATGNEITQPVDIVCVPASGSMTDIPDSPTFQKVMLSFTIPSGLLNGAYNEGAELDLYAEFPAENIVQRDPSGNWCGWNGSSYDNLLKGQGSVQGLNGEVWCLAQGPDGKIYVGGTFTQAGGVTGADYLARWNPVTKQWEAVVPGLNSFVNCMAFDANHALYIGGAFTNLGNSNGDSVVKLSGLDTYPATINTLGTGIPQGLQTIAISPRGVPYFGAWNGGVYYFDGSAMQMLGSAFTGSVYAMVFSPDEKLYIGGGFINASYPYLCYYDFGASQYKAVSNSTLDGNVWSLAWNENGKLLVGGEFRHIGSSNFAYLASWNGRAWEDMGAGLNGNIYGLTRFEGKLYAGGSFTTVGGMLFSDRVAVYYNGAWQPLDIDLPGTANVWAILPVTDGSLYIGGGFSSVAVSEKAKCSVVSNKLYAFGVTSASANTYPYMQISGAGNLRSIINHSTGKSIIFDGLTIQQGETLAINFDPVKLSFKSSWAGRGNLLRHIVPGSDYGNFFLKPGGNSLSLFFDGTDVNRRAWIAWTPLLWGLDGAVLT